MDEKQKDMIKAAINAGIDSPKEIANFIAQISHESGGLTRMNEGFRYTRGISQIPVDSAWRQGATALEAARQEALKGQPKHLAELMYGGRMGNDEPGDGFKYHGRGYVQLTGKDNYRDIGKSIGVDLVSHPELAASPENVSKIALEFWKAHVPQSAREDVTKATRYINGGNNGLAERKKLYNELYQQLTPEFLEQIKKESKVLEPEYKGREHSELRPDSKESKASFTPRDTTHPNHELYSSIVGLVKAHEVEKGITWGEHSEKLCAALTTEGCKARMTKVDELAQVGPIFHILQDVEPPKIAKIDSRAATQTPEQDNFKQLEALNIVNDMHIQAQNLNHNRNQIQNSRSL